MGAPAGGRGLRSIRFAGSRRPGAATAEANETSGGLFVESLANRRHPITERKPAEEKLGGFPRECCCSDWSISVHAV